MPDEMLGADGRIRPLWIPLAQHLAKLTPTEAELRRAKAEQYLRDSGVFYRQYSTQGSAERPWPLSPVPVILGQEEWDRLTPALIQRADLLEALMADLYGPNQLVAEGLLPAQFIAANPEWLRPMVGIRPKSGHFLDFIAFDIGRGEDGTWRVLADRTQAPSGAGYALENRVATMRAFSDLPQISNLQRLAGFFRDLRDDLLAESSGSEAHAVILSPGPMNETYFEHSYIARYLGITLVQGEDLTILHGRPHVRTVAGPQPTEIIWRRLDSTFADPVELDPHSQIGTPGLVSALRQGGVRMINTLGSGVLEARAFMAFLPRLAQRLLGEPLLLPNIETLWLGEESACQKLLSAPEGHFLAKALSKGTPFDTEEDLGAAQAQENLAALLAAKGSGLIAQRRPELSTTPAYLDQRLVARPMALRVFLARIAGKWQLMPGGFARISDSSDPRQISMQRGGLTADLWVISPERTEDLTNFPPILGPYRKQNAGTLPARSADNLFWLGRYIERIEASVRLLRACNIRLAEGSYPLLQAVQPLLDFNGINLDRGIPQGLLDTLAMAITTAGRVRDRFSPDAWSALADINKTANRMAHSVTLGDDAARALSALLRKLAGISGLVHENMYRGHGWRFLTLARYHERAMGMAASLAMTADPAMPIGGLDLAVELGDSAITHRRRFAISTTRATVIDLLGLDADNPRSLLHQVNGLRDQIAHLPHVEGSELSKSILRLQVALATESSETLTSAALWDYRAKIARLSDLLTEGYFR